MPKSDFGRGPIQICACGGRTRVCDSRPTDYGIRRRHQCMSCGFKFSSVEIPAHIYDRLIEPRGFNFVKFKEGLDKLIEEIRDEVWQDVGKRPESSRASDKQIEGVHPSLLRQRNLGS